MHHGAPAATPGAATPGGPAAQGDAIATRIRVAARIRPLTPREAHAGLAVTVPPPKGASEWPTDLLVSNNLAGRPSRYQFDAVLTDEATQANVFDIMAAPLVLGVCQGINAALFAYGQTGTGKTHTMLGVDIWQLASSKKKDDLSQGQRAALDKSEQRGVIPRSMQLLFAALQDKPHKISVSYFEIYNEKILDLLAPGGDKDGPGLEVREDKQKGVHAVGAVCRRVHSVDEVLDALWRGARNRAVCATDMNEHSSRSHTIFQVLVETKTKHGVTSARLSLVDLAGSEKWRPHQLTEFSEQRIMEMTSINKSLSNLGNCIRGLMQSGRNHIPYRDSKLTRLLQDSLGGNAQTGFVVTVSPSEIAHEETMSTLQFADRAKRVSVKATVNEDLDEGAKIAMLEAEVKRLKEALQLADFSAGSGSNDRHSRSDSRGENSFAMANKAPAVALAQLTFEPKSLVAQLECLPPTTKSDEALLKRYHDAISAGKGALDALAPVQRVALMEWSVVLQAAALQRATEAFEKDTAQHAALVDSLRAQLREREEEIKAKAAELEKLCRSGSTEVAHLAEHVARKEAEIAELRADARSRASEVEALRAELRASVHEQRALKERLGRREEALAGYGTPSGSSSSSSLPRQGVSIAASSSSVAVTAPSRLSWEDQRTTVDSTPVRQGSRPTTEVFSSRAHLQQQQQPQSRLASRSDVQTRPIAPGSASRSTSVDASSTSRPIAAASSSSAVSTTTTTTSKSLAPTSVEVFSSQKHARQSPFNSSRHRASSSSLGGSSLVDERPPPAPPSSPAPANVWHVFVDAASGKKYYFCRATNQTTWQRPTGSAVIRGEA